jgi:hypothetical protein
MRAVLRVQRYALRTDVALLPGNGAGIITLSWAGLF